MTYVEEFGTTACLKCCKYIAVYAIKYCGKNTSSCPDMFNEGTFVNFISSVGCVVRDKFMICITTSIEELNIIVCKRLYSGCSSESRVVFFNMSSGSLVPPAVNLYRCPRIVSYESSGKETIDITTILFTLCSY